MGEHEEQAAQNALINGKAAFTRAKSNPRPPLKRDKSIPRRPLKRDIASNTRPPLTAPVPRNDRPPLTAPKPKPKAGMSRMAGVRKSEDLSPEVASRAANRAIVTPENHQKKARPASSSNAPAKVDFSGLPW